MGYAETRIVDFHGLPLIDMTMTEALDFAEHLVTVGRPSYMVSLNADIMRMALSNEEFRSAYEQADLRLIDSTPLFRIANRKGVHLQEKVCGSDFMPAFCARSAQRGFSSFILGGAEGVPERAAHNLQYKYPGLKVVGTFSPEYGFEQSEAKIDDVVCRIREASPDVLYVCLGAPKSELLISKIKDRISVPLSLCVGASVDFESGNKKRAPKWVSDSGFEWLYRWAQEPSRLTKRYLADAVFLVKLVRGKV